ncbi:MAG: CapA family protein [Gemmatimonadaceae bacterium]
MKLAARCSLLLVALALPCTVSAQRAPSASRPTEVLPGPGNIWSLAAVGDAIITRRVAQFDSAADPRFQQMAKVIRAADAAMVNLELSAFRFSEFKGWPEVENGGNWEVAPPEVVDDLQHLGFDLFNRANNHTTDYGVEGMRMTDRLLDQRGVVHAGSGENLGAASRPGYLDTPKGRVAFIGLATSFTPMSRAGDPRPDMVGRPGMNALRVEVSYEADAATFESLRAAAAGFSGNPVSTSAAQQVRLLTQTVRRGTQTRTITTVNAIDEARILREIRNASALADYVVVTGHTHQSTVVPPAWLQEWARKCLDAGATTYVMQGPHLLRGIEIYKGKPIFYSLANFVFQNETIDPMPQDHYEVFALGDTALAADLYDARFRNGTSGFPSNAEYYESVVAVPTFKGTQLIDLKLYPIELGHTAPRSQRGTPRLADEATGRKIIDRLAKMSAPLGTTIAYENGVGVWRGN